MKEMINRGFFLKYIAMCEVWWSRQESTISGEKGGDYFFFLDRLIIYWYDKIGNKTCFIFFSLWLEKGRW